MKILPRPKDARCLNVEDVTRSDKALNEPNEVGDFAALATDLGGIRVRILSIVDGKYVGKVLDCSDEQYGDTEVEFEEGDMVAREKLITS